MILLIIHLSADNTIFLVDRIGSDRFMLDRAHPRRGAICSAGGDTRSGTSMYVTCLYRRPRRRYHGISGRRLVEMLRDSSRES